MTVFAADLLTEVQQRLGDSTAQIWGGDELNRYITDGYDLMTHLTQCLFGVEYSPDYAFAFNITASWEFDYAESISGFYCDGPANFTSIFERDYLNNAKGPANINNAWEYNGGYQIAAGTITEISPLFTLPDNLHDIERVTLNTRRARPLMTRDSESADQRFELNKGIVEGYYRDKDGIKTLRKWRVPSSAYVAFTFDDGTDLKAFTYTQTWESTYIPATNAATNGPAMFTSGDDYPFTISGDQGPADHNEIWEASQGYIGYNPANEDGLGIIRDMTGISTATVVETLSDYYGDLVQVDNTEVFEDFGILVPYQENLNLHIEYARHGKPLTAEQPFEIPDRYTIYVRHYVLARALEREGPGQDLALSAHFQSRWDAGIARMMRRKQAMVYEKGFVMGGRSSVRGQKPPRVKMPWQYGPVVR